MFLSLSLSLLLASSIVQWKPNDLVVPEREGREGERCLLERERERAIELIL